MVKIQMGAYQSLSKCLISMRKGAECHNLSGKSTMSSLLHIQQMVKRKATDISKDQQGWRKLELSRITGTCANRYNSAEHTLRPSNFTSIFILNSKMDIFALKGT